MKEEVQLNVFEEPQDHFTGEDDSYLSRLISEKQKGSGLSCVIMKDAGKEMGTEVMHHWFNVYGAELKDYMKNNFD